ncbi:MAG: hypothetical protein HQM16_13435 [Deltaproteobacteria bacterium]|nr:hypothetical protein [Deltaproteobacteria bacterium]
MHHIDKLSKYLWYIAGSCVVLYIFSCFFTEQLPDRNEILKPLYKQPQQQAVEMEAFVREYDGKKYMIRPRFTYELYGLVVSYQDLDKKWFNIYYKDDPYNIKDLCVIWGSNLFRNDFQKVSYKSGTWTCYFRWDEQNLTFTESELSNNHILPQDQTVSEVLKYARKGDQVHFKGYLVDYSVIGAGGGVRKSSITRNDTGDGACEVVYVAKFEILKTHNKVWRFINHASFGIAILALVMKVYVFFFL